MAQSFFQELRLKNQKIVDAQSVELNQQAISDNQVPTKLQAETISALAVQAKIIQGGAVAADTVFSSDNMASQLATKQPNMEIDPSSVAYLEIVDGYKIKLKDLGIITNYKDTSAADLSEFILSVTYNGNGTITTSDSEVLDANTLVFLESATNPSQRSFVYLGTNNGDSSDFVSFSVDYNTATIRTFFDSAGIGLQYESSTGKYSLVLGNGANDLGAHSLPIDGTLFNVVNGATVLALLQSLEAYIQSVDSAATGGQTTLDTRLTSLAGVSGNNLGIFIDGYFSNNSTIKAVLQESESAHKSAGNDRALIRSQFADADAILQNNINFLGSSMDFADTQLQTNINSEASARISGDALLQQNLNNEQASRVAADGLLSDRLDVVEGSGAGSIAKAQSDAQSYADAAVLAERNRAELAEAALDLKVDNLATSNIEFVAMVNADGTLYVRLERRQAGDNRNGTLLKNCDIEAGEVFVAAADFTLIFNDGSSVALEKDDKMMAVDKVTSGLATVSSFNITQDSNSALSQANLDDQRIELTVSGFLDIVDDSVGRTQLDSAIEADIDDKRSLTQPNASTSDGDTHFVTSSALGAQQNTYQRRTQLGSDPLSGTVRTTLTELFVNTSGSGTFGAPTYAHASTTSTHYQGSCLDPTQLILAGANFECNANASSAIQATGVYASALEPQNGINIGITALANGAAISNVGAVAFAGTAGVGKDRGLVASVSTSDITTYSIQRQADVFPFDDIAIVADAKYGPVGCMAFYSYGPVKFDSGVVEVEDAPSTDKGIMRLGDVKSREAIFEMDLVDGVQKLVPCSLDLNKCMIEVIDDGVMIGVDVQRDQANNQLKVTASGGNLTGVRVLVRELSCSVTSV